MWAKEGGGTGGSERLPQCENSKEKSDRQDKKREKGDAMKNNLIKYDLQNYDFI